MIKLHPRVRETSGYGIPTVNVNLYRMFMKHPQIIAPEETANAPRLIAGPDNRVLYTQGNRVYAYGLTEPGRYLTYRVNKNITDPETGKFLGQEVVFSGIANTLPYTQVNKAMKLRTQSAQPLVIEEAVSEIRKDDYLLKLPEGLDSFNVMPHAPARPIQPKSFPSLTAWAKQASSKPLLWIKANSTAWTKALWSASTNAAAKSVSICPTT